MVALYLAPSIIAFYRKHPSKGSIIAVNILLGWSIAGWIWAFIWSLGTTRHNVVVINPSPVAATPQNASAVLPVASKTIAERISELKAMLDSGTINQSEFEALKADAMKAIS
ncbi:superinfection immunity protein [Rhizobium sp. TH2]|nr:superinfection immunity protein [Rhizobium sp. TH2]